MPDIGLFEAIYSARSIRRLKPDPVPEELVTRILDAAIRAPSGGNAQSWAFLVVRDPGLRQRLGGIYRKASDIAAAVYAARGRPAHLSEGQFARMMTAGVPPGQAEEASSSEEGEGADFDALARPRIGRCGRVLEGGVGGPPGAARLLRLVGLEDQRLVGPHPREPVPAMRRVIGDGIG